MPVSQLSLDGGHDFGWVKLYGSTDPVKREYAEAILDKILETQNENDWEKLALAMRRSGGQEGLAWRVAGDSDPIAVEVYCGRCKDRTNIWMDTRPTYRTTDGRYIRPRRTLCPNCQTRTVMWPTDDKLRSVCEL
jgi:ribosomal protein S27AE